jgi:hypothetical protein
MLIQVGYGFRSGNYPAGYLRKPLVLEPFRLLVNLLIEPGKLYILRIRAVKQA